MIALVLSRGPNWDRIQSVRSRFDAAALATVLEPHAQLEGAADLGRVRALALATEPYTLQLGPGAEARGCAIVLPSQFADVAVVLGAADSEAEAAAVAASISLPAFSEPVTHLSLLRLHARTGRMRVVWRVALGTGEAALAEFGGDIAMAPAGCNDKEEGDSYLLALASDGMVSRDQQLHVALPPSAGLADAPPTGDTLVLVAADNSGSMAGAPWRQCAAALATIATAAQERADVALDVVVYNSAARLHADPQPAALASLQATGRTDFSAAFAELQAALATRLTSPRSTFKQIVTLFLTDGHDTSGHSPATAQYCFSSLLKSAGVPGVVHVVGFGGDHSYDFLDKLRLAGTAPGTFSYTEQSADLGARLLDLFSLASTCSTYRLDLPGYRFAESGCSSLEVTLPVEARETTLWVTAVEPGPAELSVMRDDAQQLLLPVGHRRVESRGSCVAWSVRLLCQRAETLLSELLAREPTAEDQLLAGTLQDACNTVNVFGGGMHRAQRLEVLETVQAAQARLNSVFSLLAGTATAASRARANDLRFAATFSRARRQRRMDQRSIRNANVQDGIEERLAALGAVADPQFDAEALDFYFCSLSQLHVADLLRGGDGDVMGFGLAVQRPECVVDDPTQLRIASVSGTLLSKSAMEDAVRFSISLDGELSTHGGFEFSPDAKAVVGRSREPINAWLPLYVSAEHWQRVAVQLEPVLGYFCTLDPLGFAGEQLQVPLLVLGSMLAAMGPDTASERHARLLLALLRTCRAIATDCGLMPRLRQRVEAFKAGPQGRTRAEVPSLLVLMGSLLVVPSSVSHGFDWGALATEAYRRGGRALLHSYSPAATAQVVAGLVLPEPGVPVTESESESVLLVAHTPDKKLDAAMEIVGRGVCDSLPGGPASARRLLQARAKAAEWLAGLRRDAEADEVAVADPPPQTEATEAMLAAAERFERRIGRLTYPAAPQVAAAQRVVTALTALDLDAFDADIDSRGGIAGPEWASAVSASTCTVAVTGLRELLGGSEARWRAALCQAARFSSNREARIAIEGGAFASLDSEAEALRCLEQTAALPAEASAAAREAAVDHRVARAVNTQLVSTSSEWAFVGFLSQFYSSRDRHLADLVALLQDPQVDVPLRAAKVRVLLSGRMDGHAVIDNGNCWLPERAHRDKFVAALGVQQYSKIEVLLRGRRAVHVYRVSDIPNRHGHCNSSPYVPLAHA